MFSFEINEDRTIWLGFTGSLLIHGLLFGFSGVSFIQHAQYSVRPVIEQSSSQTLEISIEEINNEQHSEAEVRKIPTSAKSRKVSHSSSGVKVNADPDYYQNPPPEYPELAKQMHQEGLVMLSVDVDRDGMPVSVEVVQSSGHRLLDQAALKAVRHWKFQPGRIGGLPVESKVTVPIRFSLEGQAHG